MKIGVLGLALRRNGMCGGNLGCLALGYSFFEILNRIAIKNGQIFEIVCVGVNPIGINGLLKCAIKKIVTYNDKQMSYYSSLYSNLSFFKGYYWEYGSRSRLSDDLLSCDFVIDFTAGDSFTDLYGRERFFQRTRLKEMVEESGIPLILGSQTIGPFKDEDVREMAIRVLEKSKCVYVRDKESMQYVEQISSVKPILTTDIAFFLPYERRPKQPNVKKIGFNPSGLLWWGGYTKDNQFELKVDYQMYCRVILEYLLNSGYEVHLIMHAYFLQGQKSNSYPDNDRLAVESLYKDFPTTIIAPSFQTPMEAKSYISGMDLFIGARMHATIAALSASIPVIPFSYSRKFEGLFSSLEYPYVVEGTKWETKKAIDMTKNWVLDSAEMKNCISKCEKTIEDKNNFLLSEFNHTIENFSH